MSQEPSEAVSKVDASVEDASRSQMQEGILSGDTTASFVRQNPFQANCCLSHLPNHSSYRHIHRQAISLSFFPKRFRKLSRRISTQ